METGAATGWERWKPAPVEWLYLLAGLCLILQYAWLLDDAFVFFRYVDNLLFLDLGLVYNQGEYVEGFSSPFWALLLIALRSTGLDYWLAVRGVACLGFALFWMLLVRLNREFVPRARVKTKAEGRLGPAAILNLPLAFLALNYGLLCYFSSGTESPLVALLAAGYALFALLPGSAVLQVALALSPLVRPELLISLVFALLYAWRARRRIPWLGLATAALANGSWLLFRVYYYADLFPNTFYLKDSVDLGQGWSYLLDTALPYQLPLLCTAALAALIALRRVPAGGDDSTGPKLAQRLIMLAFALPVALYVVRIGGDPRHLRYLVFPFVLVVCSLAGLPEQLYQRFAPSRPAWGLSVAGIAVALWSFALYPAQLSGHPLLPGVEHRTVAKINDAYGHRKVIHHRDWAPATEIEKQQAFRSQARDFRYTAVVDTWVCMQSYMQFDRRIINNLGLTDPILARTEMEFDRPAHKFGLYPLAADLRRIQEATAEPGRGMYRRASERGIAPGWITENLDSIELIERKVYNRHDLVENLRLAFTPVERITP